MTIWTASMVEERLEEAAGTLRRLPPIKVQGYFGVWPEILHDHEEMSSWEPKLSRQYPPSAAAISRMEATLFWFRWLEEKENHLIWMRANHIRWKAVCAYLGCSRATAFRKWIWALTKLAYALENEQRSSQPQLPFLFTKP